MVQDDTDETRVATPRAARWLRLLKLVFTVISLAIGILRALGLLPTLG